GDDDDFGTIPNFGVFPELALEHADGAGTADIMGHQHVRIDPDIVAGLNRGFTGSAGEDFFCECHMSIRSIKQQDSRRYRRVQLSSAPTSKRSKSQPSSLIPRAASTASTAAAAIDATGKASSRLNTSLSRKKTRANTMPAGMSAIKNTTNEPSRKMSL